MKLTERKIGTLAVEQGQKDQLIFNDEQRGLAVRVQAAAAHICANTRFMGTSGGFRSGRVRLWRFPKLEKPLRASWATWQRVGTQQQTARKRQRRSARGGHVIA